MRRISLLVAVSCWLLLIANNARADLVDIAAGSWSDVGTGTETWNRVTNPSGSLNITIPVLNNTSAGSQTSTFYAWALGVEIIPQGGATGSLTVGSISEPSNNVFASPDSPTLFTNASPAYQTIGGENGPNAGVTVPTSGDNLISFNLTSANGVGTFNVYAFSDASGGYSNWTYFNASNLGDPNNANSFAFESTPFTGSFPTSESRFLLGTITVLGPSAVPEPGSMILAGIASAGFAGYGWRRKRRQASAPLEEGTLDDAVPLADSATSGGLST